jgi:hypothetical protein
MTAEITLTRGKIAIVDDVDYEWLSTISWQAVPATRAGNWYARTAVGYMHRMIAGIDGLDVDHKDRNGLNNTRKNLRPCTRSLNIANATKRASYSGYRGVYWDAQRSIWVVRAMSADGKTQKSLGRFVDVIEAAKVRDAYVHKLYGEFASLNFPVES